MLCRILIIIKHIPIYAFNILTLYLCHIFLSQYLTNQDLDHCNVEKGFRANYRHNFIGQDYHKWLYSEFIVSTWGIYQSENFVLCSI